MDNIDISKIPGAKKQDNQKPSQGINLTNLSG